MNAAAPLNIRTDARFMNRAGAVFRVVSKHSYTYPTGTFTFFLCVIERMANGETPELEYKVSILPDGRYSNTQFPHELDLISEVAKLGDVRSAA